MFIIDVIKKEDAKGELQLLYKMIERSLGFVPPHFELFATIDREGMKEFAAYNVRMQSHKSIDKNILPHLRLAIAQKECRTYCIGFNTKILEKGGFEIDAREKLLMQKVLKALQDTEKFDAKDISELEEEGFTNKDFFYLLNYATNFMAKSKMIEVYLKRRTS